MKNSLGLTVMIYSSLILVLFSLSSRSVEAYKNYTVGDSQGWFDNSQKPDVDYQKWASAYNFTLGDFLIFNTDTNHTVVQTYNETTYKLCNYDDSSDNETITVQWSSADPSNTATQAVSVAVPLLKQGTTYFFSSDYDGDQCHNGQHFEINISHGKGLPKSLQEQYFPNAPKSSSSASSPGPAGAQPGDGDGDGNGEDESAPDTIVPASFSHPHKVASDEADDDDESKKSSASVSFMSGLMCLMGFGLVNLF